jgi:hypothetical protein
MGDVDSASEKTPQTLADVLGAVRVVASLILNRRRDLTSAIRSVGRMSRRPLAGLPAQPRELRVILDGLHPAAFEISAKRFSNIRADLARALDVAMPNRRSGPPWPQLDPA